MLFPFLDQGLAFAPEEKNHDQKKVQPAHCPVFNKIFASLSFLRPDDRKVRLESLQRDGFARAVCLPIRGVLALTLPAELNLHSAETHQTQTHRTPPYTMAEANQIGIANVRESANKVVGEMC